METIMRSTHKKRLLEQVIVPTLTEEQIRMVTNPSVLEELLRVAETLEMYEICSRIKKQNDEICNL